jgi:hypothetical protein
MLEDDMHCMAVTLRHRDGVVTAVEPLMERRPWTTCPGAIDKLAETFLGQPLSEVTARRAKRENCTHLHDLACLAAAHAADGQGLTFDISVSDPLDGERLIELRRDGECLLHWRERDGRLVAPVAVGGLALAELRGWIATLPQEQQEPARLLQWAGLVAHGRSMSLAQQQAMIGAGMPPSCYTFQPERAVHAIRDGTTRDFSPGGREPLDGFSRRELARALGE